MPKADFEKNTISKKENNNGKEGKIEREGIGEKAKLQQKGGKGNQGEQEGKDGVEEPGILNRRGGTGEEGTSGGDLVEIAAMEMAGGDDEDGGGEDDGGEQVVVRAGCSEERGRDWEVWKESDWDGEVVRYLFSRDFGGRHIGFKERPRIRGWAWRCVLFDG